MFAKDTKLTIFSSSFCSILANPNTSICVIIDITGRLILKSKSRPFGGNLPLQKSITTFDQSNIPFPFVP